MFKLLFKLRGELPGKLKIILQIGGVVFLLLVWLFFTTPMRRYVPDSFEVAEFEKLDAKSENELSAYYRVYISTIENLDKKSFRYIFDKAFNDIEQELLTNAYVLNSKNEYELKKDVDKYDRAKIEKIIERAGYKDAYLIKNTKDINTIKNLLKKIDYKFERVPLVPVLILPHPLKVLTSFKELHTKDALIRNTVYSIKLNFGGYLEALLISIPLGFLIGLLPLFKGLFNKPIDALRFVPLTAVTGLFIAWFGIESGMKIQFLAFGIIVYLLPVVVQRVSEVDDVYVNTVFTLGASKWQTFKTVFWPSVLSKISDDIRVLVAISWTYIIVAEMINKGDGGIGALAFMAARQSRVDKVFAVLFVIIVIGFLQDRLFVALDRGLFPHKYK